MSFLRLNRELSAKEREVEHLLTDLQKTKAEAEEEKKAREAEAEELKRKGEEAERRAAEAEERLRRQSDYEAVKRDLAIMRSVEFPGEDGEQQEEGDEVRGKNIIKK